MHNLREQSPQDYPPALTQTATTNSRVPGPPSFQTGWLQIWGFPQTPSSLITSQKNSQNSTKWNTYNYSFILAKGYKLEQAKGGNTQGEVWEGPRCNASMSSGVRYIPGINVGQHAQSIDHLEGSLSRVFIGVLLYRHNLLNDCLYH